MTPIPVMTVLLFLITICLFIGGSGNEYKALSMGSQAAKERQKGRTVVIMDRAQNPA
jgi:hypothetical protein